MTEIMHAQPAAGLIHMEAGESEKTSRRQWPGWPPQAVLLLTFAALYFAIGPGNFFSTEEVGVEEMSQALVLRHTLDIPLMNDSRLGRAQSYYAYSGPGLSFAGLPFVYLGLKLDDAFGSMNGGPLAGYPIGAQEEQPLRWSGRLAISASLIANALISGGIVALLFMVGTRLSGNPRAALLMAVAAGVSTLVMSEATHLFQHALSALMLMAAFWFFGGEQRETQGRRALFGGLSLGVVILSRPNAGPAAFILWLYGMAVAWKLVRDLPDRRLRALRQGLFAAAGPAAGAAGCLYFNYLRFGSITDFGYALGEAAGRTGLAVNAAQIAKAIAAYLLSPALSIFLFAPPLILAVVAGRQAYRRWPLETAALLSGSVAILWFISLFRSWHGDVSYGPRYLLEAIVLLMPLTLPAFEVVADLKSRRAVLAVGGIVLVGALVQLVGVAVYVTVNQWDRTAAGLGLNGAWVFAPSVSPIVCDLKEILAGRNLAPWALRALAQSGWALALLFGLMVAVRAGGRRMLRYFRSPVEELAAVSSDGLAMALVLAAVLPILAGFALVRPIKDAPGIRVFNFQQAGLAAQARGESVAAAEDYAMMLSLDPSNKFARYDLGILEQDAGHTAAALALYGEALRADPSFAPARLRIAAILRGKKIN